MQICERVISCCNDHETLQTLYLLVFEAFVFLPMCMNLILYTNQTNYLI